MSAPVFILTPDTLEPVGAAGAADRGDLLALTGAEAHHAVTVRRLRAGERVDLVDGAGLRLVCEVEAAEGERDRLMVRVAERIEEPPAALRLVLVQALAKGGRDEQAVETATEVGVDTVVPWQAERCVSVWRGPRAAKGRARWRATARRASKQARRARVPRIEAVMTTGALIVWAREVVETGGAVLVLHEESTAAVVVGPEGGISDAETIALENAGATAVRLGPHVMRTASAGPVALAVLAQCAGLWG